MFAYRLAPHSTTGISPSELLLGRKPRSRLDLLKPNTAQRVEDKQLHQKAAHDVSARHRKFELGDLVYVLNFRGEEKWIPGEIVQLNGSVSFCVQLQNGKTVRRHQNHLGLQSEGAKQAISDSDTVAENVDGGTLTEMSVETAETLVETADTEEPSTDSSEERDDTVETSHSDNLPSENVSASAATSSRTRDTRCYPQQARKGPDRFQPSL